MRGGGGRGTVVQSFHQDRVTSSKIGANKGAPEVKNKDERTVVRTVGYPEPCSAVAMVVRPWTVHGVSSHAVAHCML